MHENPAEVFIVFLQAVIHLFDLRLGQETQDALLELPGALAGDYLHQRDPFFHSFFDNPVKLGVYHRAFVEAIMQIQNDFSHTDRLQDLQTKDYQVKMQTTTILLRNINVDLVEFFTWP